MNDQSPKPYVGGCVKLPYSMFDKESAKKLTSRLTFTVKAFHQSEKDREIKTYLLNDEERMVTLPYAYGLKLLQNWDEEDLDIELSEGSVIRAPRLPDPFHPSAPPGQDQFFDSLYQSAVERRLTYAIAPTGSGKTVAALYVIGKIGRTALIVVHNKELALQWRREIKKHLGFEDSDIGTLENGKCFYQGRKIVVAVVHNTYGRRLSRAFKRYFGIVVYDEVDRLAAECFNKSFRLFCAKSRIALTATPERRDGLTQIITDAVGTPNVWASSDALPCQVRIVDHATKLPEWRYLSRSLILSRVAQNRERNEMIAKIVGTLYKDGRNILVLSDRVGQLQVIGSLLIKAGVPEDEVGLYTRSYEDIEQDENGKEIIVKRTFKEADLKEVRENARIILSTYGMGKTGIDIPRLDAGIDATPRSDGVQAIGRIRRPFPNKKLPVWFTIRDTTIPILRQMTVSRVRDYKTANVEVLDYGTP